MTMKKFLATLFALLVLFVVGCGGGGETASDDVEDGEVAEEVSGGSGDAEPAEAVAAAVSADAATITGMVKFEGAPPAAAKLQMGADPSCAQAHSTPVMSEEVVVGPAGELGNVLVYIKDMKGNFPAPATAAMLDQKGCQYIPHVSAVQVGQTLEIKNSDPTLHNVHALPQSKLNKEFNEAQPVQNMVSKKKFDKKEVIKFKCDVHGWMTSYITVLDHPFFGVSNQGGTFTIANLPPGSYTLEAWHEKYGTQTQQITVGAKESKAVAFTFKAS